MKTWLVATALLLGLVIASAVAVVFVKHQSRKLFVQLQNQRALSDALAVEWGQLQIEESSLADVGMIETRARTELKMRLPTAADTVVVLP